jgi:hypothetical protein
LPFEAAKARSYIGRKLTGEKIKTGVFGVIGVITNNLAKIQSIKIRFSLYQGESRFAENTLEGGFKDEQEVPPAGPTYED